MNEQGMFQAITGFRAIPVLWDVNNKTMPCSPLKLLFQFEYKRQNLENTSVMGSQKAKFQSQSCFHVGGLKGLP